MEPLYDLHLVSLILLACVVQNKVNVDYTNIFSTCVCVITKNLTFVRGKMMS